MNSNSMLPSVSIFVERFIQRSSEAMQSAERTGWPSWNLSLSRKVKV